MFIGRHYLLLLSLLILQSGDKSLFAQRARTTITTINMDFKAIQLYQIASKIKDESSNSIALYLVFSLITSCNYNRVEAAGHTVDEPTDQ